MSTKEKYRRVARENTQYRVEQDAEVDIVHDGAWVHAWSGPNTWTRVWVNSWESEQ